jgi:hypothetical protein
MKKMSSDMQQYITATLDRCLAEGQSRLGNRMLILSVIEALLNRSNGMYVLSETKSLNPTWAARLKQLYY